MGRVGGVEWVKPDRVFVGSREASTVVHDGKNGTSGRSMGKKNKKKKKAGGRSCGGK